MKVLITGAQGAIASIILKALDDEYKFIRVDIKRGGLPQCVKLDVAREYSRLKKLLNGVDAIVHLAWDLAEDFPNYNIIPENKKAAENIYQAAKEAGVKKIIIASSVHADNYQDYKGRSLNTSRLAIPDTPYGASKLYIEALGKMYAYNCGLDVIAIRFGGVNKDNEIRYEEDPSYDKVLLYKEDCVSLIKKCLNKKATKGSYRCLYAVSNNPGKVHSTKNDLGWTPKYPIKK